MRRSRGPVTGVGTGSRSGRFPHRPAGAGRSARDRLQSVRGRHILRDCFVVPPAAGLLAMTVTVAHLAVTVSFLQETVNWQWTERRTR